MTTLRCSLEHVIYIYWGETLSAILVPLNIFASFRWSSDGVNIHRNWPYSYIYFTSTRCLGPHHSLNFRSLNVEMLTARHNTVINHNRAFINQSIQPQYESHHYQETDLFTHRNLQNSAQATKLKEETIPRISDTLPEGSEVVYIPHQRLIKSTSLEEIYSSCKAFSHFDGSILR